MRAATVATQKARYKIPTERDVACPTCDAHQTKTIDSRYSKLSRRIRRRRECFVCKARWTTYEEIAGQEDYREQLLTQLQEKLTAYEMTIRTLGALLAGSCSADSERLDWLIEWFGMNDDFEGSGVRDWVDKEDARKAIDEVRQAPSVGRGLKSANGSGSPKEET